MNFGIPTQKTVEIRSQQLLEQNTLTNPNTQLTFASTATNSQYVSPTTELSIPSMPTKKEIQSSVVQQMPAPAPPNPVTTVSLPPTKKAVRVIGLDTDPYPLELTMFPVRCYTCGFCYMTRDKKLFEEKNLDEYPSLEEAAKICILDGMPVTEFLERNRIERMCCRMRIIESPYFVQLQKDAVHTNKNFIAQTLSNLDFNNTSTDTIFASQPQVRIINRNNNDDDEDVDDKVPKLFGDAF